jgi:integrase/recombinase XerD
MAKQWLITPDKYLSTSETKQLTKTIDDAAILAKSKGRFAPVRDNAIIHLALGTGLRVSELTSLKVDHIHFKRGSNQIVVYKGKGDKDRIVTINNNLKSIIQQYMDYHPSVYLFPSERGEQLTRSGIQQIFKKWANKAGLPKRYSIHSLRHTYATNLYKASGYNLRLVQKQLGHSSISTTQVYADTFDEDLEIAVEKLDFS